MRRYLVLILLIFPLAALAQRQTYKDVDEYVKGLKTPIITEKNMSTVAHQLADKWDADSLKARAIFVFVSNYYDYDYEMVKEGFGKATLEALGVCWQYCQLFCDLGDIVGLETRMIYGWSKSSHKDINKINKKSYHSWNMVKIDGIWRNVDCTWASGYMDTKSKEFVHDLNDHYFLTNKELFELTHHPDSGFQYIAYSTQSLQSFYESPWYHTPNFPKEFYFRPSGPVAITYGDDPTPSISFIYTGEIKPATWTYTDLKEKKSYNITPEIKDGKVTFTFPETLEVTGYVSIQYAGKTLVTVPVY